MTDWVVLGIGVLLAFVGLVVAKKYSNLPGADIKLGPLELKAKASAAGGIVITGTAVFAVAAYHLVEHSNDPKTKPPRLTSCETSERAGTSSSSSAPRRTQVAYIKVQREHPFFAADIIITIRSVQATANGGRVTAQIRDAPQTRKPALLKGAEVGDGYRRFIGKFDVSINCIDNRGARVTVAKIA